MIAIHQNGGFQIRNWVSNSETLLAHISAHIRSREVVDLDSGNASIEKALGLVWDPNKDQLGLAASLKGLPSELPDAATKRVLLKYAMSVFDLLGFLSPYTVTARMLLQDLWRLKVGWDDDLPSEIAEKWHRWLNGLQVVARLRVPRCYSPTLASAGSVDLHGFVDASEKAFAAVTYLCVRAEEGPAPVAFVAAKARIAPLKPLSFPRLELQAAILGTRLADTIQAQTAVTISSTTFWSDSRTVLLWVKSDARPCKSFVAHRIGEIVETTNPDQWRWVPTKDNPADDATCGLASGDMIDSCRWISGPAFLKTRPETWPVDTQSGGNQLCEEVKSEFVAIAIEVEKKRGIPRHQPFLILAEARPNNCLGAAICEDSAKQDDE